MDVFLDNFYFIFINSFLALAAVSFGWLMNKAHSIFTKVLASLLWLLFLPNTIYILTDISHIIEQWPTVNNLFRFILIIQYSFFSIFGIITFILAVYFFQTMLEGRFPASQKKKIKPSTFITIFILNFIVGFGVVLGGIQRTNSWHVFTDPLRVLTDTVALINSQELLILSAGFGILSNLIYFLFSQTLMTWGKKYFKSSGL